MKTLLLFITSITLTTYAQLTFNPTYNLSNTPYATSDYHSVYSYYQMGPSSYFYVVWGDNGEIKFKRSSDLGNTWSVNKTLSSTANVCGYPVLIADGNNIVVLYHEFSSTDRIIYQKSTDNGETWTPMYQMPTQATAITPQLAYDGSNLYAVWEERPAGNYEIYFAVSQDFGSTWWITPMNLSQSPGSSRWVQLRTAGSAVYCAWVETSSYPLSDIYFRKSTNGGYSWTPAVNLTDDARPQNRFYLTAEGNNIYLACDDIPGAFEHDEIYLIKSTDAGTTWSSTENITNNAGHSNTPCIELADNIVYLTWADNSHTAPAYDNMDIFFKWSSDGGATWQDSLNLSGNPESSSRPRICRTLAGTIEDPFIALSVIWYDYSTGDAEILARNAQHYVVPVELVSFNADAEGNSVRLSWLTASEINNKGFEIERTCNGSVEAIAFLPGQGTTTEPQNYSFTDRDLAPGKYTYRLRQVDFDGSFEYSQEIDAEITGVMEFSLSQNYPNPFNPSTKIRYSVPLDSHVKLTLNDLLGNEVRMLLDEVKSAGTYEIDLDAGSLASGVYFYRMHAGEFSTSRKLTVLK